MIGFSRFSLSNVNKLVRWFNDASLVLDMAMLLDSQVLS